MKIDLRARLTGTMVGLAIGDMLGAPVEFKDPGEFVPLTEPTEGGTFNLAMGYWTDDTSMALCLADSLLEYQGYNSYDVMNKYWLWRSQGYRSSTGKCFDIGNQTSTAINQYISEGGFVKADTPRTSSAGNGCIMRLAPVVIAAYEQRKPKDIIEMAILSAKETHFSSEAEIATEVFATLLLRAIEGKTKSEILEVRKPKPTDRFVADGEDMTINGKPPPEFTFKKVLKRVMQSKKAKTEDLNTDGYIIYSLQIAIWAFNTFESFEEGALAVVNLGGDTDTNCAIYGQLAGAFYGYNSIPSKWREVLHEEKEICDLVDKLIDLPSCPIVLSRFEEDNFPA